MRSFPLIAALLLGAGCISSAGGAAPRLKRVVGSNDLPAGEALFSPLTDRAGISASGDVLMAIDTAGGKRGAYRWSQSDGVIVPILVTGEPAPGLPGETLRVLTSPGYIDQHGNVTTVFNYTTGAFSRKSGIWSGSATDPPTIQLLAADGHSPFFSILSPRVSQEGTLALIGTVRFENGLIAKSLYRGAAGELPQALLTGGDPVPVALDEDDPNKNVADLRDVAVDNNGRASCIVSRRQLGDFGMILAHGSGAWSEVARLFIPAAGTEHDFRSFDGLTVAKDTVVFTGTTTKGPSGQPGIWRVASDGTIDLIAVAEEPFGDGLGSAVSGIPGATLFVIRLPLVADTGACFFSAALVIGEGIDVSNNDLILRSDGSGLRVVIREGAPAPGLPSAEGWRIPQLPGRFAISPDGRLAMIAEAQNAEGVREKWLWVSGVDGALEPVMKVGDAVNGKPIANIEIFVGFDGDGGNPIGRSGTDGMTGPFNARGELVVGITHPDERVIYIVDFVNVAPPDPVSIRLSTPILADGKIRFSFSSEDGRQYRLEGSDTLAEWQPVGEVLTGSGGDEPISEPVQGGSFYYRIVAVD
jgi:hypothetical protein